MSNPLSGAERSSQGKPYVMPIMSLYDSRGSRKYLTGQERGAFAEACLRASPPIMTFGLTLLYTGARISEALRLPAERMDRVECAIILETLKRRRRGIYRAVPVPPQLISRLAEFIEVERLKTESALPQSRIWTWGRTTAWKCVKSLLETAQVPKPLRTPRALRHAFGVSAIQNGVALNVVQRWMGHARIETTAIYADALGNEERALAERTWVALPELKPSTLLPFPPR
jgi:integrase/recombinase XerD